jgi:hypothetical protein
MRSRWHLINPSGVLLYETIRPFHTISFNTSMETATDKDRITDSACSIDSLDKIGFSSIVHIEKDTIRG